MYLACISSPFHYLRFCCMIKILFTSVIILLQSFYTNAFKSSLILNLTFGSLTILVCARLSLKQNVIATSAPRLCSLGIHFACSRSVCGIFARIWITGLLVEIWREKRQDKTINFKRSRRERSRKKENISLHVLDTPSTKSCNFWR